MVIADWLDVMLPFRKTQAKSHTFAVLNSDKLLTFFMLEINMRNHLKYTQLVSCYESR